MRALLLAVVLLLALPGVALAQVDEAADALRKDPVYVDPSAPLAGEVDADALRAKIRDSDASPIYIAVIPEVSGQSAGETLQALHDAVGIDGTYAVVAGHSFRAGADNLSGAREQATIAAQEHSGDLQGALEDFIGRVGDLRAGRSPSGSGASGGVPVFGIFLLIVLVGGGLLLFTGNRRRKQREAAELEEVKDNVRDDLVALGDDIRALDLDVEMPNADPAAKADYAQAVESYERANRVFETARSTRDLAPAAEALEEGRYAMTSAKARFAGEEPPERRPPCFFDPRHGPSSRDVEWAPPAGGTP
ncbi:MAG TPA: hypothetical protein VFG79_23570, partial [Solirubrobacter sp.]|nr:hypothetical protein [Solirubrobacter sp.]